MTLCRSRKFDQDPAKQLQHAFKTGKYSHVIHMLQSSDMLDLMQLLNQQDSYIVVSPDLFALSDEQLGCFFSYLPKYIQSLVFNFSSVEPEELNHVGRVLKASQAATDATIFSFVWDFIRLPMCHLVNMPFVLPGQLTNVNFSDTCLGAGLVDRSDWDRFAKNKLGADVKLNLGVHYSHVVDQGRNTAFEFSHRLS